jgi:hypothetical protein
MLSSHRQTLVDPSHGRVTLMPWLGANADERSRAFQSNQALAIVERWRRSGGRRGLVQVASWLAPDGKVVRGMSEDALVERIREAVAAQSLIALPGWVEAKRRGKRPVTPLREEVNLPPSRRNATGVDDEPTIRLVSIESPHFVPRAESIKIAYAIDGPVSKATAVFMRVKALGQAPREQVVEERVLPAPYEATGTVSWNGEATLPAGCISVRGSPYEVTFELTSASGAVSASEAATVAVRVASVHVKVDSAGLLPVEEARRASIERLADELAKSGMPGDCSGRVVIDSPVFHTNADHLGDTSAAQYAALVGEGIAIPLLAEIRLKSKTGGELRSPAAVVGTRVLWDFAYPDAEDLARSLDARGVGEAQKRFLTAAMTFQAESSAPKGTAAPRVLGGRRGSGGSTFWKSANDWPLVTPSARTWAAFTPCGGRPMAKADAGIHFLSGRIAGDTYRICASVDLDEALDRADDDAPLAKHLRSNTITLTNWRRVPVVADWYVGTTAEFDYFGIEKVFRPAALTVEQVPGLQRTDMTEHWVRQYAKVVMRARQERWRFLADALDPDPGEFPLRFVSVEDFHQALAENRYLENARQRVRNFRIAPDDVEYRRKCAKFFPKAFDAVTKTLELPDDGLTLMKFGGMGLHNKQDNTNNIGGLFVPDVSRDNRGRAIVFQFTTDVRWWITSHEIGHALFLAHAPGRNPGTWDPDDVDVAAHDRDSLCIMSYTSTRTFCGLCLLKLAGYDYAKVGNDGIVKG